MQIFVTGYGFGFVALQPAQRQLQGLFIDYIGKFPRSKTGNYVLLYALMCSVNLFRFFLYGMLLLPPGYMP
jgi:hypothetical protein